MTETQVTLTRQALKTPRSAAIAGIIFAVLYGASMVLLNISLSQEATGGLARTVTDPRTGCSGPEPHPVRRDCFSLVHWRDSRPPQRQGRSPLCDCFPRQRFAVSCLNLHGRSLSSRAIECLRKRIRCSYTKRCIDLRPIGDISCLQHLCHPHGRCVHDITGHNLAPYRRDAPWLGLSDVRVGAGVAAEYRLFLLGDLDLTGMGAGG